MKVHLLNKPDMTTILTAAQVCRNSKNPQSALAGALKAGHDSLLEHVIFQFAVEGVSRSLTHQLIRHRIGVSPSQQSQRHVTVDISNHEWYVSPATATPLFHSAMQVAGTSYLQCIEDGMPVEDARYLLPNAAKTKVVLTCNARALAHLFNLRLCYRAQDEIRELAHKLFAICHRETPELFRGPYPDCDSCKEPCEHFRAPTKKI